MKLVLSALCLLSPFLIQAEQCELVVSSIKIPQDTLWQKLDVGFELLETQNYETAALTFETLIQDCYENMPNIDLSLMLGAVIGELFSIDALGQSESFYRELGKVIMSFGSQMLIEKPYGDEGDVDEFYDPMDEVFANTKISKDMIKKLNQNCSESNFRKFIQAIIKD